MQQSVPYEITITALPPAIVPLDTARPKGHSLEPRYANTEAEALAKCRELVDEGYTIKVTGPDVDWGHAEIQRRVKNMATVSR
jgi:hypothetical protein